VFSLSKLSKIYAWSRYTLPWAITDACAMNGKLYVRADDAVYVLDEEKFTDDVMTGGSVAAQNYEVTAQWPWLDLNSPGVEKMLTGVDVVIRGDAGTSNVSIGYDENDTAAFTPELTIDSDTRPGGIIPIPASGASFSTKLTMTSA